MSRGVLGVAPDADTADVARTMLDSQVSRVPVVDGGRLVGVISRSDFLAPLCRGDQEIADELGEALRSLPGGWQAAVREGQVSLSGSGGSETAARIAWAVPGVLAVCVEPVA